MGWTEVYHAGPTKPYLIGSFEGDPLGCNSCSYHEADHPRQSGREYDSIYGPKPDDQYPAPHEFVPHVQRFRVLDYSQVGWGVVYMAVENLTDNYGPLGSVFAAVVLVKRTPDGSLTYKDMTETSGPYEFSCPERILDRLSPIEDMYGPVLTHEVCDNHRSDCANQTAPDAEGKWHGWDQPHVNQRSEPQGSAANASEWRKRCRDYHAKRKGAAKVKAGAKVRFAQALRFTDGSERSEFEFVKGSTFRSGYGRFRISNWRDLAFEVVPA